MLYIGADHRGFYLKEQIKKYLDGKKISYKDMGNTEYNKDDDYPDFAYLVARLVLRSGGNRGILICGSGIGVAIVANKFRGIRAGCARTAQEIKCARNDDNINVLCLSGDEMSIQKVRAMIDPFLGIPFSLAKRHRRRIEKIRFIEEGKWKPK